MYIDIKKPATEVRCGPLDTYRNLVKYRVANQRDLRPY